MSAPPYVPTSTPRSLKAYDSPPRRADSWVPNRPGELTEPGQPTGSRLGVQGPDQGYALKLARRFDDRLVLGEGEHRDDVIKGAVGVALKRASLYGRAPVAGDIELALSLFGYLDDSSPAALVEARSAAFQGIANPHHYREARDVVDLVPAELLRGTPAEVLGRRAQVEATLAG